MSSSKMEGNILFRGIIQFLHIVLPAGCVKADHVETAAGIEASKLEHQHAIEYSQADGSDVVAAIVPVHIVRGSTAEIIDIEVACVDAPSGGDKAFTVDLKKANEGTPAPASVLTGVISYSSTQSDCEVEAGVISSEDLADGDTLLVVVAVSGSTGVQGQGLIVTVNVREDAD